MSSIFEPRDQHQVAQYAESLLRRANLVRRDGWQQYRHIWSCGEVIGTALLLGDNAELHHCGETTISALERWAFDLWGLTGGVMIRTCGWASAGRREWAHLPEDDLKSVCLIKGRRWSAGSERYAQCLR